MEFYQSDLQDDELYNPENMPLTVLLKRPCLKVMGTGVKVNTLHGINNLCGFTCIECQSELRKRESTRFAFLAIGYPNIPSLYL